jgi:hypothetical protein
MRVSEVSAYVTPQKGTHIRQQKHQRRNEREKRLTGFVVTQLETTKNSVTERRSAIVRSLFGFDDTVRNLVTFIPATWLQQPDYGQLCRRWSNKKASCYYWVISGWNFILRAVAEISDTFCSSKKNIPTFKIPNTFLLCAVFPLDCDIFL